MKYILAVGSVFVLWSFSNALTVTITPDHETLMVLTEEVDRRGVTIEQLAQKFLEYKLAEQVEVTRAIERKKRLHKLTTEELRKLLP